MTMATSSATVTHVSNWNVFFKGMKLPHPPGQPDKQLSIARRIAFVLNWTAERAPNILIPYNVVLREIMGFTHTPRLGGKEVDAIRKKLASSRPILQEEYKRDLHNVSGLGCRATTGALDVAKHTTPRIVGRLRSDRDALRKNAALVNVAKLPETGPDKGVRDWFVKTVSPMVKLLSTDARFDKLLPPPSAEPKKDDGEKK
jgi:hypothetical protein